MSNKSLGVILSRNESYRVIVQKIGGIVTLPPPLSLTFHGQVHFVRVDPGGRAVSSVEGDDIALVVKDPRVEHGDAVVLVVKNPRVDRLYRLMIDDVLNRRVGLLGRCLCEESEGGRGAEGDVVGASAEPVKEVLGGTFACCEGGVLGFATVVDGFQARERLGWGRRPTLRGCEGERGVDAGGGESFLQRLTWRFVLLVVVPVADGGAPRVGAGGGEGGVVGDEVVPCVPLPVCQEVGVVV